MFVLHFSVFFVFLGDADFFGTRDLGIEAWYQDMISSIFWLPPLRERLELDDLHVLSEKSVDDLTAIDLLFDGQLLHKVSYFAFEIDRQVEFAVGVVELAALTF